jgi:hypothetical protein
MVLTGTTLLPQGVAEAAEPTMPGSCVGSSPGGVLDRLGVHLGSCDDRRSQYDDGKGEAPGAVGEMVVHSLDMSAK